MTGEDRVAVAEPPPAHPRLGTEGSVAATDSVWVPRPIERASARGLRERKRRLGKQLASAIRCALHTAGSQVQRRRARAIARAGELVLTPGQLGRLIADEVRRCGCDDALAQHPREESPGDTSGVLRRLTHDVFDVARHLLVDRCVGRRPRRGRSRRPSRSGVSCEIELRGEILGSGRHGENAGPVGHELTASRDGRDFGLAWNSAIGGLRGGLSASRRAARGGRCRLAPPPHPGARARAPAAACARAGACSHRRSRPAGR
jgi:hypothetical protein